MEEPEAHVLGAVGRPAVGPEEQELTSPLSYLTANASRISSEGGTDESVHFQPVPASPACGLS